MSDSKHSSNFPPKGAMPHGPMRGPNGGRGPNMRVVEKPKNFRNSLFRLIKYMKPYRIMTLFMIICILLETFFHTLSPKLLGDVTTTIFNGIQENTGIDFTRIFYILFSLSLTYLLNIAFSYLQQVFMSRISQKMMQSLRREIDLKLAKLPLKYFDSQTYGEVLSRVTNDVDTISNSLQQTLSQIVSSLGTFIMIVVMMLMISPTLTLVAALTLPFSFFLSAAVVKKSQKYFRGQQKSTGRMSGHIEEMYSGHTVIKLFSREKAAKAEFDKLNEELYENNFKATFASSVMMPITGLIGNIGYVAICVIGGLLAASRALEVGGIQAFIQYLRQFNMPLSQIANIANVLQSTVAAAERIFELCDEEEEPVLSEYKKIPEKIYGDVEFKNVCFGYTGKKQLIKNLNLKINRGEKIAIVGPTGAGKTTLVNLLMRFYDLDSGHIMIDSIPCDLFSREDLRKVFGMVLQDTWLFNGTIRANLAYGNPTATDEEIDKAAKRAHIHSFIKALPNGYDFLLNEDATNISQGQKQLLTIARAFLKNPKILILDEATSSVDTRTEVLIQKAMADLTEGRTSFIIAHRLSTIRDADKILVMNDGAIIEQGNHESLMKQNGFYAELYNSQFTENNAV
ncbi:MAG: ABC transporter ATP-binding protein [Ruminococcaceae bacterium]|nr:ABC transporter ATP-binding protein [Oscillospiraceae bacterium]